MYIEYRFLLLENNVLGYFVDCSECLLAFGTVNKNYSPKS